MPAKELKFETSLGAVKYRPLTRGEMRLIRKAEEGTTEDVLEQVISPTLEMPKGKEPDDLIYREWAELCAEIIKQSASTAEKN